MGEVSADAYYSGVLRVSTSGSTYGRLLTPSPGEWGSEHGVMTREEVQGSRHLIEAQVLRRIPPIPGPIFPHRVSPLLLSIVDPQTFQRSTLPVTSGNTLPSIRHSETWSFSSNASLSPRTVRSS